MSQPESNPGHVRSKHFRKEQSRQLVNGFSEQLHMSPRHSSPHCMCYMNMPEHTWTALGCRPNSTCKVACVPSWHLASSLCFEPCLGHHYGEIRGLRSDMSRPEIYTGPPPWEASTLEKRHPDSLLMAIQNIYIWALNRILNKSKCKYLLIKLVIMGFFILMLSLHEYNYTEQMPTRRAGFQ